MQNVYAQNPNYQEINRRNGIPSSSIFSIAQRSDGAILMGGTSGMYVYDGKTFEQLPFQQKPRSGHVFGLQMLPDESYLFLNAEKHLFHYRQDTIYRFILPGYAPDFKIEKIHAYCRQPQVVLLEQGSHQLILWDWINQRIQRRVQVASRIFTAAIDHDQNVWVVKKDSLCIFTPTGQVVKHYFPEYTSVGFSIRLFCQAHGRMLFFSGQKGKLFELCNASLR
ncbi:MAG: hypothetical protein AAFR59_20170 [Bacteroidota bacterium]